MANIIEMLKTKLEEYVLYRFLRNIHNWIADKLGVSFIFPIFFCIIGCPILSLGFFTSGIITWE